MEVQTRDFMEKIWAIFFPKRCPFCGNRMTAEKICCDQCRPYLPFLDQAMPRIKGIDGLYIPFRYEGIAIHAIYRLKFYGTPSAARPLSRFMADSLPDALPFDCIIPVPMFWKKQRRRGYNQAELLARFLSAETGIPMRNWLCKTRNTREQHTLSHRERRHNLHDAFALRKEASPNNCRILLVDDVITTGNTIQELAAFLRQAGACSVSAAAVTLTCHSHWKLASKGVYHGFFRNDLPHSSSGNSDPAPGPGSTAS